MIYVISLKIPYDTEIVPSVGVWVWLMCSQLHIQLIPLRGILLLCNIQLHSRHHTAYFYFTIQCIERGLKRGQAVQMTQTTKEATEKKVAHGVNKMWCPTQNVKCFKKNNGIAKCKMFEWYHMLITVHSRALFSQMRQPMQCVWASFSLFLLLFFASSSQRYARKFRDRLWADRKRKVCTLYTVQCTQANGMKR